MKSRSRFESSVLGAVGKTVGERCPRLASERGAPLAAVADILEEEDGTGFVVQLEGVGDDAFDLHSAIVILETPGGERVRARKPFADADGYFALEIPMQGDRLAFFIANGALEAPPPRATVRLVLHGPEGPLGQTAFAVRPTPADPLDFAAYAQPFADLAWAVAMADGNLDPAERTQIGLQLKTVLGDDEVAVEAFSKPPLQPPKVSALAVSLRCRFAELDSEELFFALLGVAASDGEVSPAEVKVLQKVARRLDVPERAWHRWAFRMGVELPNPEVTESTDLRLNQQPPLVVLAAQHGRRVPSIILQLDRKGQDRRNVFATLSLLTGIFAVVAWFASVAVALAPSASVATFATVAAAPLQMAVAALSVGFGWLGLRVARETEGAGQGAATTGLSLGGVCLLLGLVWWLVVCLGLSATAIWDQRGL